MLLNCALLVEITVQVSWVSKNEIFLVIKKFKLYFCYFYENLLFLLTKRVGENKSDKECEP